LLQKTSTNPKRKRIWTATRKFWTTERKLRTAKRKIWTKSTKARKSTNSKRNICWRRRRRRRKRRRWWRIRRWRLRRGRFKLAPPRVKSEEIKRINAIKSKKKELTLFLRLYKTTFGGEEKNKKIQKENGIEEIKRNLKNKTKTTEKDTKENLVKTHHLQIQFLIDTGAECSLINYQTYLELKRQDPEIEIRKTNDIPIAANDISIGVIGTITTTLSYESKGKEFRQIFLVYEKGKNRTNIVGGDFIMNEVEIINFRKRYLKLTD